MRSLSPAEAVNVDAPKNCTVYAVRKHWRDSFASAMEGSYEPLYAPVKCHGVYVDTGSKRKAYMAQPPDYKCGFIISAN